MKGMWNSEKSADTTYRPAIDALSAVDSKLVALALAAVVSDGAALMFGTTRDYGAVCLTLMSGNDRRKVYPSNVQELEQALRDLVESFGQEAPTAKSPPKAR